MNKMHTNAEQDVKVQNKGERIQNFALVDVVRSGKEKVGDCTSDRKRLRKQILPQKKNQMKKFHPRNVQLDLENENRINDNCNSIDFDGDCILLENRMKQDDLSNKPKDETVGDGQKNWGQQKSNDLKTEIENFRETRLDKIPKDILGMYGIVFEDGDFDMWKCLEEQVDLCSNEGAEEDRSLIINEEERLCVENESERKTNENSPEFTNCGHHLVISSVRSLKCREICNICGAVLPNADSMEIHKKGHCNYPGCLDHFTIDSERVKHLEVHRSNPSKPFRCNYCRKRFHYYKFAKRHIDGCKLLKRTKCPYCSYTASKVVHFNRHIVKHVNQMTCTECKKSYIRVKKFARHLYSKHRKEIWFQCPQCPIRFQQSEKIIRHVEIHKMNILQAGLAELIQIEPAAVE